jgi:glycosyltransferase involved in cell wall biosynthesis
LVVGRPSISVVIPARDAARTLDECLAALSRQTLPCDCFEIIVVNDGSSDDTVEVAQRWGARLISQPKRGPAAARNRGVCQARGEIVLFTDADCAPAEDWVERLSQALCDPEIVGAKGTYRTRQREIVARFVQLEYEEKYDKMRHDRYIDFVDTYSAAYRRAIFETHGGFDLAFPRASGEDIEFSYRLSRLGCKIVFVPQAIVYHRHVDSAVGYLRRKFYVGYWRVLMYRRHPQKMVADSHTPQTLKLQVIVSMLIPVALLVSLVRREVGWGLAGLIAFLVTTVPFCAFAWRKDRWIALLAPGLLLLRASALAAGLVAGALGAARKA